MFEVPETRFVRTPDGSAIAFKVTDGQPPDILLMGNPPCIDLLHEDPVYAHVHRRLSNLGRVITFDYRGCGSSDPVSSDGLPTPEAFVEDIGAVLDAVGSTGAILLGQGLQAGGWAMLFSAFHPDRVSGLVIVDGAARMGWAEDYPFGQPVDQLQFGAEFMVGRWGSGDAASIFAPSRATDPAFIRWHARFERLAVRPAYASQVFPWMFGLDVRAIVDTIRVPTLLLTFDANLLNSIEQARWLEQRMPSATLKIVHGSGENIQFSAADADAVIDCVEEMVTASSPPARESTRTLTTVLFTDIVDSTGYAITVGDKRWRDILNEHHTVVESEIERFRGRKVNTTGDGALATFDGPARGIRCALAIVTALQPLGIHVRAGLHTGEIELNGNDVAGIAVHIGARVCGLAVSDEVLVSSTVRDLVIGSGIKFKEVEERELKGIPGTWRLFAALR